MQIDVVFHKKLKKNNRKAQNIFYEMSFSFLMRIAIRYKTNKDDAAILVNEAFMKILKDIHKISVEKPISPWMRRIMINTCIDDYRKNESYKSNILITEELDINTPTIVENDIIDIINAEELQSLLNQLPRATNNVFNLHVIDGYSHKEIGELLNISVETSKWHMKQARRKMRVLYTKKRVLLNGSI